MNRRELLCASAGSLAGSLTVVMPLFGQTSNSTPIPWKEDATTTKLESEMTPQLERVKARNDVYAMTGDEWAAMATNYQAMADEDGRLGNLHTLDLAIQANQTTLKAKYGAPAVDFLLLYGTHRMMSETAGGFLAMADKMKGIVPVWKNDCTTFWTIVSVMYAIVGFFLVAVPVIGPLFFLLGIVADLTGVFLC